MLVRFDSASEKDSVSLVGDIEKLVIGLSILSKVSSRRDAKVSRPGEDVKLRRFETIEPL